MAALSKHYANIVGNLHCTEIFHPGRTCAQYASENFGKIFQLCAKFYTPMVLVGTVGVVGGGLRASRRPSMSGNKVCSISAKAE